MFELWIIPWELTLITSKGAITILGNAWFPYCRGAQIRNHNREMDPLSKHLQNNQVLVNQRYVSLALYNSC